MQLPERGRARRGAARTFPFGIPVWDARRQWRGGDTPFEERKGPVRRGQSPQGRDRALGPHSKEGVPSNAPAWSISWRDGTGSSQATSPQAGTSVPKEAFGHRHGLDLPRGAWADRGSGGFLIDQKPQCPERGCPGSPAILQQGSGGCWQEIVAMVALPCSPFLGLRGLSLAWTPMSNPTGAGWEEAVGRCRPTTRGS